MEDLSPPAGARRQARERAMSLLYEAEAKEVAPCDVLAALPVQAAPFATDLVTGVGDHKDEVDDLISRYSRDWAIERMPAVDRAVLRVATFELLHRPDVPTGVVLAEAVELVQRFSTDDSARFVNGVLAAIAREVRPG